MASNGPPLGPRLPMSEPRNLSASAHRLTNAVDQTDGGSTDRAAVGQGSVWLDDRPNNWVCMRTELSIYLCDKICGHCIVPIIRIVNLICCSLGHNV